MNEKAIERVWRQGYISSRIKFYLIANRVVSKLSGVSVYPSPKYRAWVSFWWDLSTKAAAKLSRILSCALRAGLVLKTLQNYR